MRSVLRPALLLIVFALAACSDSPGPEAIGPLDRLAIQTGGDNQRAPAATTVPGPIVIVPQDANGRTVPNQTATFAVTAGGGSIANTTGQVNADGTITAPAWTLGKLDLPQELTVTVGGRTTVVKAAVQTAYVLNVRFFGAPINPTYQSAFTNAAARVRGFIVGSVPPVTFNGQQSMVFCTGEGSPPMNETVPGLLIFAAVDSIDGRGQTLAQAGPCYFRSGSFHTIVGLMQFDSADIALLGSRLQDVITHEMLHVVGLGSFWDDANLLTGAGGPGAGYTGQSGIAACRSIGGTATCANHVPVEDCLGLNPPTTPCGAGQRDAHWKEATFGGELMTPYLGSGPNPLSVMTIRSFEDLGYTVNAAPFDPYSLSALSALSSFDTPSSPTGSRIWERPLKVLPRAVPADAPATGVR